MCGRHWGMVERGLQIAVYGTYRDGQEVVNSGVEPSYEYRVAMWRAIWCVAKKENIPIDVFREELKLQTELYGAEPPALAQVIKEVEDSNA